MNENILLNDLRNDFEKYNISETQKKDMIKSFNINYNISWFFQVK